MLDYTKRVLDTQLRPPADADGQCLKTNKGACLLRTTGYVPSCERENAKNPLVCIISAVPLPKITRVGNNRSENHHPPEDTTIIFAVCGVCGCTWFGSLERLLWTSRSRLHCCCIAYVCMCVHLFRRPSHRFRVERKALSLPEGYPSRRFCFTLFRSFD